MSKFKINKGDYIDSREFTREECERFCELAVECGFHCGERMKYHSVGEIPYLHIRYGGIFWYTDCLDGANITTQFREFLDKEKGKMFTKDDLKDGMRVTYRNGSERVIIGRFAWVQYEEPSHLFPSGRMKQIGSFDKCNDDLTHVSNTMFDIIRVTDRDGTVLFERETEPKEMTVADIERELGYSVKVVK